MWHRYLVAFELALMGTGKFFEGILIVENTSTGAHRSSDPLTIVLQYCDERWVSMTCRAGVGDGRSKKPWLGVGQKGDVQHSIQKNTGQYPGLKKGER